MQNIRNPLAVILQTFFPQSQRTLKRILGHSKGTQVRLKGHLSTRRALQRHLGELRALGYFGTWALKALGHLDTQALWRLKGTWALEVLEILYFADS